MGLFQAVDSDIVTTVQKESAHWLFRSIGYHTWHKYAFLAVAANHERWQYLLITTGLLDLFHQEF